MPEHASGDDVVSFEGQEPTEVGTGSVDPSQEPGQESSSVMPPEAEPPDAQEHAPVEETASALAEPEPVQEPAPAEEPAPAPVEPETVPDQEPAPLEPEAEPAPAEETASALVEPEPVQEPAPAEEAAPAEVEPEPVSEEEPVPLVPEAEPAPAEEAAPAEVEPEPVSEEEPTPLVPESEPAPAEEPAPAPVEPEPAPDQEPAPLEPEAEPAPAEKAAPAEVEREPVSEEEPVPLVPEAEPAPAEEAAPAEVEPEPEPEEEPAPLVPEAEPAPAEEAAPVAVEPEPVQEPAPLEPEAEPAPAEKAAPALAEPQAEPVQEPAPLVPEAEPAPDDETAFAQTEPAPEPESLPAAEPPPIVADSESEPLEEPAPAVGASTAANQEAKKRRRLLLALGALLAALLCVSGMFWRYLRQPVPLPELLPIPAQVNYPPHYLFSVYGIDNPVGVALSPDGDRIYVAETGGERLIRVFDRDGNALVSFSPPRTRPAERSPVYLTVDTAGRVYVVDRLQKAVSIHDRDGQYIDTILDPSLTLSEYVVENIGPLPHGTTLAYNVFEPSVYYQTPGGTEQRLPAPAATGWAPLGIRIDQTGTLLLTDVAASRHAVRRIPGEVVRRATWQDFDPPEILFGSSGQGDGEFLFPNVAVTDSQGRIHVTDGNNSRICVWDEKGEFLFSFGQGVGQSALSLPRGAAIDARDRLHIVDAVEQSVKVYDVSGLGARYLFSFGDWGLQDGQFNYPNDIALDRSGRLYVADRENNRIQVWSY